MQLDIEGGTYSTSTETVVTTSQTFKLRAYYKLHVKGNPSQTEIDALVTAALAEEHFISAAVQPKLTEADGAAGLGSFDFDGVVVRCHRRHGVWYSTGRCDVGPRIRSG